MADPSLLHVRQGAGTMRFGVLALFDDGSIGDITNWSRALTLLPADPAFATDRTFVHRVGEVEPVLSWFPTDANQVDVDKRSGELNCKSAAADQLITLKSGPLPGMAAREVKGRVLGAPAWDTAV